MDPYILSFLKAVSGSTWRDEECSSNKVKLIRIWQGVGKFGERFGFPAWWCVSKNSGVRASMGWVESLEHQPQIAASCLSFFEICYGPQGCER
jgi:hypothetical protein